MRKQIKYQSTIQIFVEQLLFDEIRITSIEKIDELSKFY